MILTITGASGSGKSSLIRSILLSLPNATQGVSFSTRPKRPLERDTELQSISGKEFDERIARGDFLWTAEAHGQRYATAKFAKEKNVDANEASNALADVGKGLSPEEKARFRDGVTPYFRRPDDPAAKEGAHQAFEKVRKDHPEKKDAADEAEKVLKIHSTRTLKEEQKADNDMDFLNGPNGPASPQPSVPQKAAENNADKAKVENAKASASPSPGKEAKAEPAKLVKDASAKIKADGPKLA